MNEKMGYGQGSLQMGMAQKNGKLTHRRPKLSVSVPDKSIRICMRIPIKSLGR